MDRISAWIDEKPHRFQLMLLANTAAAPSCLRWPVSEATRPRMGSGAGGKSKAAGGTRTDPAAPTGTRYKGRVEFPTSLPAQI